jgi:hypothetical protein
MLKQFMLATVLIGLASGASAQTAGPGAGSSNANGSAGAGSGANDGNAAGSVGTSNGSSGVGGSATETPTDRSGANGPCGPNKAGEAKTTGDRKSASGSARISTC